MSYTTQNSNEWLQFRPPLMASGGFPVAIEDEETAKLKGKIPENSCTNCADSHVKNSMPKPTRRRSRAARKAPMIVLNANTKNFRVLVQQFTGCQSSSSSPFKGPINLNFGGESQEIYDVNRDQLTHMRVDHQDQHHQQPQLENMQQVYDQERVFSCGSYDGDASSSLAVSGNPASYATTIDNMAEENYAFFHDLPGDYSPIYGLSYDDFML